MSKFKDAVEIISGMSKTTHGLMREFAEFVLQGGKLALLDTMETDMQEEEETGVLKCTIRKDDNEDRTKEASQPKKRGRTKQLRTTSRRSSSLKENSREPYPIKQAVATGQKQAFMEASQISSNTVVVKIEKHLEGFNHPELSHVTLKQEMIDMPPPTKRPVRQTRKRKGTQNTDAPNSAMEVLQVKEELIEMESKKRKQSARPVRLTALSGNSRESDVQITPEPVLTVNLVDSDEEETREKSTKPRGRPKTKPKLQKQNTNSSTDSQKSEIDDAQTTRVTRTKTRNAAKNKEIQQEIEQQQSTQSSSTEGQEKEKKTSRKTRTKKLQSNKKNADTSVYEDALSDTDNSKKSPSSTDTENKQLKKKNPVEPAIMKEAVVVLNKAPIVVEKSTKKPALMNETMVINKLPNGGNVMDELMTDDEDVVVSTAKTRMPKKIKQVFSPYAESPVKKRVEAFEKLGAEANSDMPPRMAKTRAKEQESEHNKTESNPNSVRHGAIPKLKNTPLAEHRARLKVSQSHTMSAVKAEFRERELRRKQKEDEAQSKKEALIQQQTEEKRRKREERQLKAQQAREALEKDKQKIQAYAERQKEEKIKQMKAEKEEKLIKQREEAARKRAMVMKKAAEEKQREEEKKKIEAEMNQTKPVKSVPPYLKYEIPLLPTADCYDSDDSNASKPFITPDWQKKDRLLSSLRCMRYTDDYKWSLFSKPETVDLKQIFPSIEAHKLKRTSSAIWNKSGLSKLSSMIEEDE